MAKASHEPLKGAPLEPVTNDVDETPPSSQATPPQSHHGAAQEKRKPGAHGSTDDHVFSDPSIADYWRKVYEYAKYENRHRFDPSFSWTAKEEKKLVRKVRVPCIAGAGHVRVTWSGGDAAAAAAVG